ncbi:TerC family protein [Ectobacillus antri]|uniref:TerC family protein n=1 Tax=Ectobacillus antri TaxID=2486280 RepID=A0ABT6H4X0_9BACI|nr:TerC family protein [Ectobacillus antri]MDG4657456.1 TerC family protein [Ectobacillus antri]MDG5753769.1 TerC family protein [Ectobacillus antri]
MDFAILLEYGWVLLILIALEGILAADNALVLAIMVKHLPEDQRKKALFYGLAGAFIFRFGSLFLISFLVDVWQVQAIGALYLIFIAASHFTKKKVVKEQKERTDGFWLTVLKVELADIAFAVDSILAAVALAVTLPKLGSGTIGGLNTGQFLVILAGGVIGLIIMRFAANYFVALLQKRPGLESAAFLIVGWVGVKLAVYTLSHPSLSVLPYDFPKSLAWKAVFWGVLLCIAIGGWFFSKPKQETEKAL